MDKREKALRGLEACELYGQTLQYCLEQGCPYVEERGKTGECVHFLHEDAVEVLKETDAPRVLTVEEIDALPEGTVVWEEFMDEDGDTGSETTPSMKWGLWSLVNGEGETAAEHSYGIRGWDHDPARSRWWSAKPTDEQRKAVKWE